MDIKKAEALKFVILILASTVFISVVCGCSSSKNEDPPLDFAEGKPGELVRSAKPIYLNPSEDRVIYEVHYPLQGLTSVAVLGFRSRALREETFPKKRKIIRRSGRLSMSTARIGQNIIRFLHRTPSTDIRNLQEAMID